MYVMQESIFWSMRMRRAVVRQVTDSMGNVWTIFDISSEIIAKQYTTDAMFAGMTFDDHWSATGWLKDNDSEISVKATVDWP